MSKTRHTSSQFILGLYGPGDSWPTLPSPLTPQIEGSPQVENQPDGNLFLYYVMDQKGLVDAEWLSEQYFIFAPQSKKTLGENYFWRGNLLMPKVVGPFISLGQLESFLAQLSEDCGAESCALISMSEYNQVVENLISIEPTQRSLSQILLQQARPLLREEQNQKKNFLGKLFH